MLASHVHQALEQVRELQRRVLESQRFKGYSGKARAFSGTVALAAAGVMSLATFPETPTAHVIGWGVVFVIAVVANYGAMFLWFRSDPDAKRDLRRLFPTLDTLPPLFVGGVLTVAMVVNGHHRYLFGIWMCLFGLTNLSSRWVLPKTIWPLGLYYVACGTACLLVPGVSFMNPWPMGVVFFVGEWTGGFIFHSNRMPGATLWDFLLQVRHEQRASERK